MITIEIKVPNRLVGLGKCCICELVLYLHVHEHINVHTIDVDFQVHLGFVSLANLIAH